MAKMIVVEFGGGREIVIMELALLKIVSCGFLFVLPQLINVRRKLGLDKVLRYRVAIVLEVFWRPALKSKGRILSNAANLSRRSLQMNLKPVCCWAVDQGGGELAD
jgi:hypothetical protein